MAQLRLTTNIYCCGYYDLNLYLNTRTDSNNHIKTQVKGIINELHKKSGVFTFACPVDGNQQYSDFMDLYEKYLAELKQECDILFESDILVNKMGLLSQVGGPFKLYIFQVKNWKMPNECEYYLKYKTNSSWEYPE